MATPQKSFKSPEFFFGGYLPICAAICHWSSSYLEKSDFSDTLMYSVSCLTVCLVLQYVQRVLSYNVSCLTVRTVCLVLQYVQRVLSYSMYSVSCLKVCLVLQCVLSYNVSCPSVCTVWCLIRAKNHKKIYGDISYYVKFNSKPVSFYVHTL